MSFSVRTLKEKKRSFTLPILGKMIHALLQSAGPLSHWYAGWKTRKKEDQKNHKRVYVLKRILISLVSVLCGILILAGVARALVALRILSFQTFSAITASSPGQDENGFTNILLVGQGDKDHDGQDLTDTIIIASLDPKKSRGAVLLSLPRDLYFLETEKMGKGRLNSLYRDYKILLKRQGMSEADASLAATQELGAEIGRTFDLPIHGVIKVNFTAFIQAVDALGGVDIEVPYDINDTAYPDEAYGFEPFAIAKGLHHLDGATALKYARSRHTTSDFDRSSRQQQLIKALAEKARAEGIEKSPGALLKFFRIFQQNTTTTFSLNQLIGLAEIARGVDQSQVLSMQLNDRNALYDSFIEPGGFLYTPPRDQFEGAAVLLPVSIPPFPVTWKQIKAMSRLFFKTREILLSHPTIAILNASGRTGLARKLSTELLRYGFTVDIVQNASVKNLAESFITTNEENSANGLFLNSLLKMKTAPFPGGLNAEETRQVTIVLGKDYAYEPFQSLLLPD
ncbi:MAG: LCP family protein [Candidatus Peregrinibacteria bacterium]